MVIFNDNIYNNVTFWSKKTQRDEQKCLEALKLAGILDFVLKLPKGIDSELGINGSNISGGQKQRISIAREIFKEVEILILDEATSALDKITEKYILKTLDNLKGRFTMIRITHNLLSINNEKNVISLDNGKISTQ